jgi:hypothetical protein
MNAKPRTLVGKNRARPPPPSRRQHPCYSRLYSYGPGNSAFALNRSSVRPVQEPLCKLGIAQPISQCTMIVIRQDFRLRGCTPSAETWHWIRCQWNCRECLPIMCIAAWDQGCPKLRFVDRRDDTIELECASLRLSGNWFRLWLYQTFHRGSSTL